MNFNFNKNYCNGWTKEIELLRAENKELKNAMQIADQRLVSAAAATGILYVGCDTTDALKDRILELELYARGF